MTLDDVAFLLKAPGTTLPLEIVDLTRNNRFGLSKCDLAPLRREGGDAKPIGPTDQILIDETGEHAYPIIDEFAVLLGPERLVRIDKRDNYGVINLRDPIYAEAYEEMPHYNSESDILLQDRTTTTIKHVMGCLGNIDIHSILHTFPEPPNKWVDARHDSLSQLDAYRYLCPVTGKIFMQLGGSGSHAVKLLVAGARKAFLLTPMIGEARLAMQLASTFGVVDRLTCVLGVGEEMPFADNSIDLIYSGGCFHHMRLDHVATELRRVLKENGKFSGVDPWKTPLHTVGTMMIGKREPSVFCRPITADRLAQMQTCFPDMTVIRHGPILRYAFLGLEKLKLQLSVSIMMKIMRLDDNFGQFFGWQKKYGGSLVIAGTKR